MVLRPPVLPSTQWWDRLWAAAVVLRHNPLPPPTTQPATAGAASAQAQSGLKLQGVAPMTALNGLQRSERYGLAVQMKSTEKFVKEAISDCLKYWDRWYHEISAKNVAWLKEQAAEGYAWMSPRRL